MNALITKKEEKALQELLSFSSAPQLTLSYNELRGYLYGLAITPAMIQPEEWVPVIFGDENLHAETNARIRELTSVLYSVLNKHVAAFQKSCLFLPFSMENLNESDFEKVFEWTSGFEEALSLRPECWEEQNNLSDAEQEQLMNSLIVIEGIVYPEDAIDMFDHIPKEELLRLGVNPTGSSINKVMQVQFFMLQALELSVETLQAHGTKLEKIRREKVRNSSTPFAYTTSKVEQSGDCPCGSGKSFGECCGIPGKMNDSTGRGSSKQGKLIKVDFRKKKKNGEKKSGSIGSGTSYQLEVSLAYSEPSVWRRIIVPAQTHLDEFHRILQLIMGWQNIHMHHFQSGMKHYGPQTADDYVEQVLIDESRFSLMDLERELLQGIVYTYDFDDKWEHVIMLEQVFPENEVSQYPMVIDGDRACPPESIGGIAMFQEFLEYLNGSQDEYLREMFDVPLLHGYDPQLFTPDPLNEFFKKIFEEKQT